MKKNIFRNVIIKLIMNAHFNCTESYLCRIKRFVRVFHFNTYEYIHYCTLICNAVDVIFLIDLFMQPLNMHSCGV